MIALTGSNGTLGTIIADAVEATGVDARTISRSYQQRPGHVVVADGYDDTDGLSAAFAGCDQIFLMSTPDLPDTRVRRHRNAIDAAVSAGAQHIVFLSLHDAVPDSPFAFAAANHDAEHYLDATGVPFTILAPNIYAEAIAAQAGPTIAATGIFDMPFGHGAAAYITRVDIAACVAAVLIGQSCTSRRHILTGPHAHTPNEIATMLTDILGRTVSYEPLSETQYKQNLTGLGMLDATIDAFFGLNTAIADGRFDIVTPAVEELTGNRPTTLHEHLTQTRSDFEAD